MDKNILIDKQPYQKPELIVVEIDNKQVFAGSSSCRQLHTGPCQYPEQANC